jgi:hypothetical protein
MALYTYFLVLRNSRLKTNEILRVNKEINVIWINFFQKQIATILKQDKFLAISNNGLANTHDTGTFWESRNQM